MNNYHLVYSDSVRIRNFTYKTHLERADYDSDDSWKSAGDTEVVPRGTTEIPYRLWLRQPAARGVLLFECPSIDVAFGGFTRLMDLVRAVTDGARPWRVFALVNMTPSYSILYEISFLVVGEEYTFQSARLTKLRELSGIVGDEHFKKDSKPQERRHPA